MNSGISDLPSFGSKLRKTLWLAIVVVTFCDRVAAKETARASHDALLQGTFKIHQKWVGVHPRLIVDSAELEKTIDACKADPKAFASYFPNEKLDYLFDTLVAFGRYAEILSYNAKLGLLTLPRPDVEDQGLPDNTDAPDGG